MRGEVLGLDAGQGAIAGADGNRYRFEAADLRRPTVKIGSVVDFVIDGEAARDIYPVGGSLATAPAVAAPRPAVAPTAEGPAPSVVAPRAVRNLGLLAYFFRATTDDYANFRGRARRKEFWGYLLFYDVFLLLILLLIGIGIALSHLTKDGQDLSLSPLLYLGSALLALFIFGMIVPSIAVTARRLHDVGHSGWWMLLHLVPVIGTVILLVMTLTGGQQDANRWGAATTVPG